MPKKPVTPVTEESQILSSESFLIEHSQQEEPQEPQEPQRPQEPQKPQFKINEPVEQEEPQEPQEQKKRKYNKSGKYKKEAQEAPQGKNATEVTKDKATIIVMEGNASSNDFFSEYQETTQGKEESKTEEEKKHFTNFVSGYLFLICLDTILPEMLIYIFGIYDKKFKQINSKNLKLEKSEIEMLEPLADEVVKELFGTMSPVSQFIFTLTFLYGGKLMIERTSI